MKGLSTSQKKMGPLKRLALKTPSVPRADTKPYKNKKTKETK